MATEAKIKITGDEKDLIEALDNIKKESKKTQEDLGKVAKVGAVAFAGFSATIAATVAQAAKFEQIEAQFKTLTGSVLVAKEVLQELQDFSATTPFQFEDIANAGKQLIAFGTPVNEVKNRLQEIGDVAAASGAPINDLTLIFGQVAAAGKLTGERLLQLQERAVPIGPALAKTLGIAESEVKKFVSEGKVSVDEFNEAFASLSQEGGFAFGGIEAQGKTLNGLLSTLGDNFSLVANGIGQELLPVAKSIVQALIDFVGKIRENEAAVKALARILAAGAGMAAFATGVSLAGIALAKLKVGIQATIVALKAGRIAAIGLTGALTLGLGFVIAFLPEIIAFTKEMVASFEAAREQIVGGFQRLGQNLLKIGEKIGAFLKDLFTFNFKGLKESAAGVRDAVNTAIDTAFKDVKEVQQTVKLNIDTRAANAKAAELAQQQQLEAEKQRAEQAAAAKLEIKKNEIAQKEALEAKARQNETAQFMRNRELLLMEQQGASAEIIQIKKEENDLLAAIENAKTDREMELAQIRLENFRMNSETRRQEAMAQAILDREQEQALKEEFAMLDEESRLLAEATELENLSAQQLMRRDMIIKEAEAERARKQKERQQFIKDEMKFGETFAKIQQVLSSSRIKQTQQASGQLVQLQQSRNNTLKSIGKAAAVTQIGIDTAQAAMSVYRGFATIPIIGPALGIAGAAAAVAFGAEKISNVRSAQQGGVVPGVGRGDIVPTMLEPGEIVVPRPLAPTFQQQFGGLEVDPDASPRRVTEINLGTVIGEETFINETIIPQIKDQVELDNADLGVG